MGDAEHTAQAGETPALKSSDLEASFKRSRDLAGLSLRNGLYTGLKLNGAKLFGADLRGASFQRAGLSGGDLRKVDATRATFTLADLQRADFRGATLNGAVLSHADLRKADLRGAELSPLTKFDGAKVEGMKIDRRALRMLGSEHGGMTPAALADIDIRDDQMKLTIGFGGFWSALHLTAIVLFLLPYAAFLIRKYWESLSLVCTGPDCRPIREALFDYIVTGGVPKGGVDEIAVSIFIFLFVYNVARLSLVFKSRSLELAERAAGIPRRFELRGYWWLAYYACNGLLVLNMVLIALHTYRFLDTPVRP